MIACERVQLCCSRELPRTGVPFEQALLACDEAVPCVWRGVTASVSAVVFGRRAPCWVGATAWCSWCAGLVPALSSRTVSLPLLEATACHNKPSMLQPQRHSRELIKTETCHSGAGTTCAMAVSVDECCHVLCGCLNERVRVQ